MNKMYIFILNFFDIFRLTFTAVNVKNLRATHFSFVEGVNTIIWENDSGKSNAMTALDYLVFFVYFYVDINM